MLITIGYVLINIGRNEHKMTILSMLNEQEKAVLEAIRMRLSRHQCLLYLKEHGFPMSQATLTRKKKKLNDMKLKRLHFIARLGFEDQHLDRVEGCELIEKFMWQNYFECKNPYQKTLILKEIINVQPYLSSYYEATKWILEEHIKNERKENKYISSA
jgi:hypothetical protein